MMSSLTSQRVKETAREVGFDLCGITSAEQIPEASSRLTEWVNRDFHGEMGYMAENLERRSSPKTVLPDAKSVIMLGLNYFQTNTNTPDQFHGRVSRYARGRDYHKVIDRMLKQLVKKLSNEQVDGNRDQFRSYVDYGPLLERSYGTKAGLGYIGKNSMLINRQFGSFFFLAGVITSLELEPDNPVAVNHGRCGECNRCITACPTGAIVEDGVIDARKCISYLTIEKPTTIPAMLQTSMQDLIFGCDICQEVCPHNGRAIITSHPELQSSVGVGEFLDTRSLLAMNSQEEYLTLATGTPLTRPGVDNLKRNAQIVQQNQLSKFKRD